MAPVDVLGEYALVNARRGADTTPLIALSSLMVAMLAIYISLGRRRRKQPRIQQ